MRNLIPPMPLALAALLLGAGAAVAHPHIFVAAKATIVFNDAGELVAIRNAWTFDEAFSVWQVQGLDTDGDGITSSAEMQELADENIKGLAEYGFYTSAGEGSATLPFASMDDAKFVFENNRSTLSFSVEPQGPYRIMDRLEVAIADPEYYVSITLAPVDVSLEHAPSGCEVLFEPPRELSPELQGRLHDLGPDVIRLPPDLEAAVRGAQGATIIACPATEPVATTAVEAATEVAEARPAMPFGGLPPEPGFVLPRTGFLGWVAQTQEDFYQALTAVLGQIKADGSAIWILGGLSFLYGIFHAAGPGHGKVVIGSYMLANERQLKRGIRLSFMAALLQSAVAIAFVGVAAAILGLSSMAMGTAVGWIEIVSYGLVMLLGLWLSARKLFGWGHSHRHAAPSAVDAHGRAPDDPHYGHDHGHDHHHHDEHAHHDEHKHVVMAEETLGDWREQAGVVLAVGLRPCSGALVVLVFALSQGIFLAGVAAALLMGLGTATTVSLLAALAVSAKGLARRLAGAESRLGVALVWWAELIGAIVVFVFGAVLLLAALS